MNLNDGRASNTWWGYDGYGRVTSKTNHNSVQILRYQYDANSHLTNRWSKAKLATTYRYDAAGNLTNAVSVSSPSISLAYDTNNRLKSMVDATGTSIYTYTDFGALLSEDGPWSDDTVSYAYDAGRRRQRLTLAQPGGTAWSQSQVYHAGHERTQQTRTEGDYIDYTYDNAGQVRTASGKESGGTSRIHEQFGYSYDAGGNLTQKTNNALIQTLVVDNLNQLSSGSRSGTLTVSGTSASAASTVTVNGSAATLYGDRTFARAGFVPASGNNTYTAVASDGSGRSDTNAITAYLPASPSFSYDDNGNLLSDGQRSFSYDDENQLISVSVSVSWKSEFTYDGQLRRRVRREYVWRGGVWQLQQEVRYLYDQVLPIQERNGLGVPQVTYTRGTDLSGSLAGAGGIGGLLARTEGLAPAYYQADGNGNITALINGAQQVVANYLYDPCGNLLTQRGPLAAANLYRFSSKEAHPSGLIYYLYRYYDPNLKRWLNRDPVGERGGYNLYGFIDNNPVNAIEGTSKNPIF